MTPKVVSLVFFSFPNKRWECRCHIFERKRRHKLVLAGGFLVFFFSFFLRHVTGNNLWNRLIHMEIKSLCGYVELRNTTMSAQWLFVKRRGYVQIRAVSGGFALFYKLQRPTKRSLVPRIERIRKREACVCVAVSTLIAESRIWNLFN